MRIGKIIALILVLAVLAGGGLYVLRMEQADSERMTALYAEAEPLEREREALIKERDSLAAEYALEFRDYATVEILFPVMDTQIYSAAYPLMRERNIVGVLGMSPVEYPAGWNKLTVEEFKRLLADGWGTCMVYESAWGDSTYYFNTIQALCDSYEIPMPTAIYFRYNDYDQEMNPVLIEHGVKTVILNASDGRSTTVTDITGDLWFTGAMTWGYTGSLTDLELLGRTDGGNLTYTMIFEETWNDPSAKTQVTTQEETSFTAFLDGWKDMLYFKSPLDDMEQLATSSSLFVDTDDKDQLYQLYLQELTPDQEVLLPRFRSATYDTALEYHLEALANSEAKQAELDAREAALDAQIAELDARIADIYARWNENSRVKR